MKIGLATYPSKVWQMGGGEIQLKKTYEALNRLELGIQIELFDHWSGDAAYDLVHYFGSEYFMLEFIEAAKRRNIKTVVSSIFYTDKSRGKIQLWRLGKRLVDFGTSFDYRDKIFSIADCILPNSASERDQIIDIFKVAQSKIHVVPNGVDTTVHFFGSRPFKEEMQHRKPSWRPEDVVVSSGRIEPRKNQVALLKAVENTDIKVVFIGPINEAHPEYAQEFRGLLSTLEDNAIYLGPRAQDDPLLWSAYETAKVHAMVSHIETPGLSNLEAGLRGANLVLGDCPPVRDYFGHRAWYCKPSSTDSIRRALVDALNHDRNHHSLDEFARANYSWDVIARKTADRYLRLLQ